MCVCPSPRTQVGKPSLTSNAAQLVLKYTLLHRKEIVRSWRDRIYYYSSGTMFNIIGGPLEHWLDENEDGQKLLRQVSYACIILLQPTYLAHM